MSTLEIGVTGRGWEITAADGQKWVLSPEDFGPAVALTPADAAHRLGIRLPSDPDERRAWLSKNSPDAPLDEHDAWAVVGERHLRRTTARDGWGAIAQAHAAEAERYAAEVASHGGEEL